MQQNPPRERSTCLFLQRSRYHFVCSQTTQTDEIIKRLSKESEFDPLQSTEKERRGCRSLLTPLSRQSLAPRQLSHHFPLLLTQTHPRPAMARNTSPSLGHLPTCSMSSAPLSGDWSQGSRGFWETQSLLFCHQEVLFPPKLTRLEGGAWQAEAAWGESRTQQHCHLATVTT